MGMGKHDQCESYYYHFPRKGVQRSGKVEGRSPRGDKSRVGIKMPKLITSARGK